MAATDPSSDWNAPAEHWGNYDGVPATPQPPAKGQSVARKVMLSHLLSKMKEMSFLKDALKWKFVSSFS